MASKMKTAVTSQLKEQSKSVENDASTPEPRRSGRQRSGKSARELLGLSPNTTTEPAKQSRFAKDATAVPQKKEEVVEKLRKHIAYRSANTVNAHQVGATKKRTLIPDQEILKTPTKKVKSDIEMTPSKIVVTPKNITPQKVTFAQKKSNVTPQISNVSVEKAKAVPSIVRLTPNKVNISPHKANPISPKPQASSQVPIPQDISAPAQEENVTIEHESTPTDESDGETSDKRTLYLTISGGDISVKRGPAGEDEPIEMFDSDDRQTVVKTEEETDDTETSNDQCEQPIQKSATSCLDSVESKQVFLEIPSTPNCNQPTEIGNIESEAGEPETQYLLLQEGEDGNYVLVNAPDDLDSISQAMIVAAPETENIHAKPTFEFPVSSEVEAYPEQALGVPVMDVLPTIGRKTPATIEVLNSVSSLTECDSIETAMIERETYIHHPEYEEEVSSVLLENTESGETTKLELSKEDMKKISYNNPMTNNEIPPPTKPFAGRKAKSQKHVVVSKHLEEMVNKLVPDTGMEDHIVYLRNVHGSPVTKVCKYCDTVIKNRHHFRAHIKLHPQADFKPYKCPLCDYRAQLKANIARHVNIHSNLKPYQCTECGRGFNFKQKLQVHMQYHRDIRAYECYLCSQAFHEFKTLKTHLSGVHHIEKPKEFIDKCRKALSQTGSRRRKINMARSKLKRQRNVMIGLRTSEVQTINKELVEINTIEFDQKPKQNKSISIEGIHRNVAEPSQKTVQILECDDEGHIVNVDVQMLEVSDPEAKETTAIETVDDITRKTSGQAGITQLGKITKKIQLVGSRTIDKFPQEFTESKTSGSFPRESSMIDGETIKNFTRSTNYTTAESNEYDDDQTDSDPDYLPSDESDGENSTDLNDIDPVKKADEKFTTLSIPDKGGDTADDIFNMMLTNQDGQVLNVFRQRIDTDDLNEADKGNKTQILSKGDGVTNIEQVNPAVRRMISPGGDATQNSSSADNVPEETVYVETQVIESFGEVVTKKFKLPTDDEKRNNSTRLIGPRKVKLQESVFKKTGGKATYSMLSNNQRRQKVSLLKNNAIDKFEDFVEEYLKEVALVEFEDLGSPVFVCKVCSQGSNKSSVEPFKSRSQFLAHLQKCHPGVKPYKCTVCGIGCRTKQVLAHHIKLHNRATKNHNCPYCDEDFIYMHQLNSHIQEKHSKDDKVYECTLCFHEFKLKADYYKHRLVVHGKEESELSMCKHCTEMFKDNDTLQQHIAETHNKEEEVKCEECNKSYKSKASLRQHMKSHFCTFHCEICDKTFGSYSGFMAHKVMHDESFGGYVCDVCDKKLHTKGSLMRHRMVSHSTYRPFQCAVCSKTFKAKKDLQAHMITHEATKIYKCVHCDFTCKRPETLNTHSKRHTGGGLISKRQSGTFSCQICGQDTFSRQQLQTHMSKHVDTTHRCNTCGLLFQDSASAQVHMETVHNVAEPSTKIHTCETCHSTFTSQIELATHILDQHLKSSRNRKYNTPDIGGAIIETEVRIETPGSAQDRIITLIQPADISKRETETEGSGEVYLEGLGERDEGQVMYMEYGGDNMEFEVAEVSTVDGSLGGAEGLGEIGE